MQTINISKIRVGQVFEQPLFSQSGQKLLPANTPLTERQVQAMRRYGDLQIFAAESLGELVEAGLVESVDRSNLEVGQQSRQGLMTGEGQMLVAPGEEVEQHHVDAAEAAGEVYQAGDSEQQQVEQRRRMALADAAAEELEQRLHSLPLRVNADDGGQWIRPTDPRRWPQPTELAQQRNKAVHDLRELLAHVEAGQAMDAAAFYTLVDGLLEKLSRHPRRFAQLALLCPRREDYLPDHAYTVAVLAMAVAAQMGWAADAVREVGVAGLVYDLGMLMIPRRIRVGMHKLSDTDRNRVRRHPVFSVAMLHSISHLPDVVKLAALQHHERENGLGYPRGRRQAHLCDYARVLGVVDTYAATTEPRSYREAKLPYVAMEETVRAASNESLWSPAVKGLVRAAGLFPVGSYVELTDGGPARILAANPEQYDRPLVQPVDKHGNVIDQPIDLAAVAKHELAVVRAMPAPEGAAAGAA
jgi:HD-GYP domain-containing protein (c-di-GMP phosphodiesterase class II)